MAKVSMREVADRAGVSVGTVSHVVNGSSKVAEATAAKVRVLITTADSADSWTTVGVSEDVIEASWIALTDSIDYMLMRRR